MKGYIRKRGAHSYRISVYLGKGADGRKQYHYETVQGKKAAEARLAELCDEVNKRTFVQPAKMTVQEYLHQWLEYAKTAVRPSTYDMYESLVRVHIAPALGQIPLNALEPMHLQRFYIALVNGPRKDGKPGNLSSYTVKHIHNVLRGALNRAVKWRILPISPAQHVEPPKHESKPIKVWTPEQATAFLAFTATDKHYSAYLLALGAGLRRGEILGMRWRDIDWIDRALTIQQSAVKTSEGVILQQPKTPGSRRRVPISSGILEALQLRAAEAKNEEAVYESVYGPGSYQDLGLLFPGVGGGPMDTRSFTRRFERLTTKAGLPRIRFHDLRHTHATIMLQAGVNPKALAERLGHSAVNFLMNKYTHVLPTLQREIADSVDGLLGIANNGWPIDGQSASH